MSNLLLAWVKIVVFVLRRNMGGMFIEESFVYAIPIIFLIRCMSTLFVHVSLRRSS
ncbi:hypothetical protein J2Z64_000135 [Oceanobacillus polygoni]|uniref:Uncharacterized protein n=1 Tax=Oceanobacillus polygoni TaxID=1235259 RepID=A0A9X1C9Y6_9BACI|nr:hypothetical protein [Oceanobacillus polygoni]